MRIALLALIAVLAFPDALAQSHSHGHAAPSNASKSTPFGRIGDPAKATRTIAITMGDTMRFAPASVSIRRGETVRLVATNEGKLLHELVLGTDAALRKHAEEMRTNPAMTHHDNVGAVHVQPGATGELVWTFDRAGEFRYACLIPGHFEAGMIGTVVVK